ncbi:MAG: hypothetical protein A2Y12_00305 [Planctomycetes bacterium GWF2_42_9]|nr:MAG: hypothetical protein A2Y12_00305 [Planctomycetes bacterium GWF2_42_9]HAL44673.1 hypothetical protein [Phycisphaerales bacterium]
MADDIDVLLKFCDEQWTQCRQLETQRALVTNFVITVAAASLAFMGTKGFVPSSLPLGAILVFLGLYGAITSEKLYERWQFTRNRSRYWRKRIDELMPNTRLLELQNQADKEYSHHLQHIRLHWLWVSLHLTVSLVGMGCITIILFKMR